MRGGRRRKEVDSGMGIGWWGKEQVGQQLDPFMWDQRFLQVYKIFDQKKSRPYTRSAIILQ